MPILRTSRRALTLTAVVGAALLMLSGCAVPGSHPGGAAAMLALELSSNGIQEDATYSSTGTAQPGEGGLGSSSRTDTRLAISIVDGRTITDPARCLDYLARVVWSIAGPQPTGKVEISVAGGFSGSEAEWAAGARQVFGAGTVVEQGEPDAATDVTPFVVRVPASVLKRVYGSWPGPSVKKVSFTELG